MSTIYSINLFDCYNTYLFVDLFTFFFMSFPTVDICLDVLFVVILDCELIFK